jgi:hypothetical protein
MDKADKPEAYGVFKPVGHVVASFAKQEDLNAARDLLSSGGLAGDDITVYSPEQMIRQADHDVQNAGVLATIGQELNLVKAQRDLAEQGHWFLVVKAPSDEDTHRVTDILRRHHAFRAQKYGRLIIEELIEPGSGQKQVGESPDRGLDAQTRSGQEGDTVRARAR